MKHLLILTVLIFVCLFAESQDKKVALYEMDSIAYFEPFSSISLITHGNKQILDDSLTSVVNKLQLEILKKYAGQIRLTDSIKIIDTTLRHRVMEEINYLHKESLKHFKNYTTVKLTPAIDSILTATNHRFVLIVANQGFTRTKQNKTSQREENIGIAILTLGATTRTSFKSGSEVYVIIVDSQNKNIAFFNQMVLRNKEPTDQEVLEEQFQKTLVDHLKAK